MWAGIWVMRSGSLRQAQNERTVRAVGASGALGRSLGRYIPADSGMFAGKVRQIVRPARDSTATCRDLAH
jgi:hypothetical protein